MSTLEDEKTIHDIDVEITDLDPPGTVHKVFGIRIIHGQQLAFRARWFLRLLTIMGGVALLFLLLTNMPHAPKDTRPVGTPAFTQPTFVPRSLSLLDGMMYVIVADGSVNVLRVSDGSLLWQYRSDGAVLQATVLNGVVYLTSGCGGCYKDNGSTVDALRVSDGSHLWRYNIDSRFSNLGGGYADPQVAVADGMVYIGTLHGIIALDATSGNKRWFHAADNYVFALAVGP